MDWVRRILLAVSRWPWPAHVRWALLRAAGVKIGRARIQPDVFFGGWNITIGDSTYINRGCFLDNLAPIRIGNRVAMGMHAMILTSTHELGPPERRASQEAYGKPVVIGDGCWIGARSLILPGVTIGDGAVVGAGAVIVHDVAAGETVVGPAGKRL